MRSPRMLSKTPLGALACLAGFLAGGPASGGTAELTVGTEPRQTFQGFGFSFEKNNPYGDLGDGDRAVVDELLYESLNTRIARFWYNPGEPERLRDDYLARGIIPGAIANGVTELLLAPGTYLGDPDEHARTLAEDIATMRDEYGIGITATGVINEPSSKDFKILPPEHFVPLAIAMRRELEARGLSHVTILSPEWASADPAAREWYDAVESEPEALAAFDAFSHHSYNMAATPEFAERTLAHGKEYWMTEAGGPIRDGSAEFAYDFGSSVSGRFLNDLNNGVTHWVWFIGLSYGTRDVYQKLVMCEGTCADPKRIYKNWAYHHVQQITSSFPPGTVLRHVTSDRPEWPHMTWTYGHKPPLHAAAGVRPDGRWALAVVNNTRGGDYRITSWDPPEDYTVTFDVPELADVPEVTFEVCRTGPGVAVACGDTVTLAGGRAVLEVASLELITLVAHEPLG